MCNYVQYITDTHLQYSFPSFDAHHAIASQMTCYIYEGVGDTFQQITHVRYRMPASGCDWRILHSILME